MSSDLSLLVQEAAHVAGVSAMPVRLLRDGSHALFSLPDGLVARIGPPGSRRRSEQEIRVAQWLAEAGVAVVRPVSGVPQPTVVDDRPVTWWHELPVHRAATPSELGAVLRILHRLPTPARPELPELEPFADLAARIESSGWPVADDRVWLMGHLGELQVQWARLPAGKRSSVVHGDAWQGNVVVPPDGPPTLLDLDHVSLGPPEWDLIPLAVDHTDFERITADDYQAFVDAYGGYDVTSWPGYRTLADIHELRWVCFALARARTDAEAAREAGHRIACLRGEIPRPWTWTAL